MLRCKWKQEEEQDDPTYGEEPSEASHEIIIISVRDEESSYDQTCRICLKEGLLPIFVGDATEELCTSITEIGGIDVYPDDPFPKFLCQACHTLLRGAMLFRKTALLSDDTLKKRHAKENAKPTSEIDNQSNNSDYTYNSDHTDNSDSDDESNKKSAKERMISKKRRRFCKRCNIQFNTWSEYRVHIISPEHENKRMTCNICLKSFSHHYYRKHPCVRNPAYKPPITDVCDICGKKFTAKSQYKRHRLIHFEERPYQCTYCPYQGRFAQALKIHIRTHTGERPYQCDQCPSRFVNKGSLNQHVLTHKGERDFRCEMCSKGFYIKRELELHIKVDHMGIKEFVCGICSKAFGHRYLLTKHERRVHKIIKNKTENKPIYLEFETVKQEKAVAQILE